MAQLLPGEDNRTQADAGVRGVNYFSLRQIELSPSTGEWLSDEWGKDFPVIGSPAQGLPHVFDSHVTWRDGLEDHNSNFVAFVALHDLDLMENHYCWKPYSE